MPAGWIVADSAPSLNDFHARLELLEAAPYPALGRSERHSCPVSNFDVGQTIVESAEDRTPRPSGQSGDAIEQRLVLVCREQPCFGIRGKLGDLGRILQRISTTPVLRALPVDRAVPGDHGKPRDRTRFSRLPCARAAPDDEIYLVQHVLGGSPFTADAKRDAEQLCRSQAIKLLKGRMIFGTDPDEYLGQMSAGIISGIGPVHRAGLNVTRRAGQGQGHLPTQTFYVANLLNFATATTPT